MSEQGGFGVDVDDEDEETLQDQIDELRWRVKELEKSALPEGFWYDRQTGVWHIILEIPTFTKELLTIKLSKDEERCVKQSDCIVFRHPYFLTKQIEKGEVK